MRPSPLRHPLAVLRQIAGLTQKELATLLECSTPTIQAIELGKLKMSEDLASRAMFATGAHLGWLLDANPAKPPLDLDGKPFTRESFERVQAVKHIDRSEEQKALDVVDMWNLYRKNVAMITLLFRETFGTDRFHLAAYKSSMALTTVLKEFIPPSEATTAFFDENIFTERDLTDADATLNLVQEFLQTGADSLNEAAARAIKKERAVRKPKRAKRIR